MAEGPFSFRTTLCEALPKGLIVILNQGTHASMAPSGGTLCIFIDKIDQLCKCVRYKHKLCLFFRANFPGYFAVK